MKKDIVARLIEPGQTDYDPACQFIKEGFREQYKANLEVSETLFSLSISGVLVAACGITPANVSTLFLEHYTEEPIERICDAPRDRIIEISHLMGAFKGVSQYLFPELARYCYQHGLTVVTFTGTRSLLKGFDRYGVRVSRVCKASETAVSHLGGQWGSYYRHEPHVAFVRVKDALDVFKNQSL